MTDLPRIASVAPADAALTLLVHWRHGGESRVDISGIVNRLAAYAPLRHSPELFAKVRVGDWGVDVIWTDKIDLSASTLWRLAQEQSGLAALKADIGRGFADVAAGRIDKFDKCEIIARGRELHKS